MKITVREIFSKRDKKKFFKFYVDLYKDNPYAAPSLYDDEMAEFDPTINDAFRFCECRMWLAYDERNKIVGRIAGILHKFVNQKNNVKQIRFTRFDTIDNIDVSKALFNQLIMWAKEIGMEEIIGPMGFSDLGEEGMLIEGFDQDSTYIEIYNHAYYVDHMLAMGAYKVVDWNCYRITVPDEMDERLEKAAYLIMKKYDYQVIDITKLNKKQMNAVLMEALEVLDEAFTNLYGTSPLSEKQRARMAATLNMVLKPELATAIKYQDKIIGYGMIMPGMSKVLRKARGNILRAIPTLLKAMNNVEVGEMMSIGVADEHLKKGVTAIIMYQCLKGLHANGTKYLETGPELEDNHNIQNLWKNYDKVLNKRHRCWGIKVNGDSAQQGQ